MLEMFVGSGGGAPRLLHDDQDQGWHILVATGEGMTVFIEWDAEQPVPAEGGYAVDAAELARQAEAALRRLDIIHERLVRALGHDYWTYRRSPAEPRPTNHLRSVISGLFRRNLRSGPG